MIRYRLQCDQGHQFEAWFRSSEACDEQLSRGFVTCSDCGSVRVEKALMAPNVVTRKGKDLPRPVAATQPPAAAPSREERVSYANRAVPALSPKVVELLRELRRQVEAHAEYVGDRFAEEARKIHYEETEPRGIYGEATREEAEALAEEGIDFSPLPILPEDRN
jgi:hypothetical protein